MIKYKHLLTFRMVDFDGNVAYDSASIVLDNRKYLYESEFMTLEKIVIETNRTELASIVLVNSIVMAINYD